MLKRYLSVAIVAIVMMVALTIPTLALVKDSSILLEDASGGNTITFTVYSEPTVLGSTITAVTSNASVKSLNTPPKI